MTPMSGDAGDCVAIAQVADSMVGNISGRKDPGAIVFKDATERELDVVLSFRGLAQALVALGTD